MTPRSLLILILRVMGILLLEELVLSITQLFSTVWLFFSFDTSGGLLTVFISLASIAIIMALAYWFIFKTEMLIDKFGLDKGFAEPSFQFKITTSSILQIALIITAAIILFLEIPLLGRNFYRAWQQSQIGLLNPEGADWSPIIISVIRIILALLLIGERKRIVSILENKNGETNSRVDNNELK